MGKVLRALKSFHGYGLHWIFQAVADLGFFKVRDHEEATFLTKVFAHHP